MLQARMRPRFMVSVPVPPEALRQTITQALGDPDAPVGGQSVPGHVDLWIAQKDQHTWSPWLSVELRPDGDGTRVEALYGPAPPVWTAFMAAYAVLAFGLVMAVMFGWAQMVLDRPPSAFLGAFAAAAGLAGVYGGALLGQGLGHDQMDTLRGFLDRRIQEVTGAQG